MTKLKMLRATASVAAGLTFAAGVGVAGASSGSIDTTGPNSRNIVKFKNLNNKNLTNNNNVGVTNGNSQSAYTGNAKVKHNTTGGNATSGDADNANSLGVNLTIDNSGCGCDGSSGGNGGSWTGDISNTGPHSFNKIKFTNENNVNVTNNNNVGVNNSNTQTAASGSARVSDNTTGGDATSGSASNTNETSVTISLTN